MNKKGSVVLYGLMVGLVVIILALALAPAILESTTAARAVSVGDTVGMNCSYTTNISHFQRAACIATDMSLFYFIGFLLFLAGAVVTAKLVFSGGEE